MPDKRPASALPQSWPHSLRDSAAGGADPARPIDFGEHIMEAFFAFTGGLIFTVSAAAWALRRKP